MTTDGQPLPTARLARGGDFTPDPALYPFASRWLASSVGAMHYSDEGSGPAILFCHGNPTSSSLYRGIIERLRGRFRCVAADLHGFGLSERPVTGAVGRRLVRVAMHFPTPSVGLITKSSSPGGWRLVPVMPDPRPASGSTARGRTRRGRTRRWQ